MKLNRYIHESQKRRENIKKDEKPPARESKLALRAFEATERTRVYIYKCKAVQSRAVYIRQRRTKKKEGSSTLLFIRKFSVLNLVCSEGVCHNTGGNVKRIDRCVYTVSRGGYKMIRKAALTIYKF